MLSRTLCLVVGMLVTLGAGVARTEDKPPAKTEKNTPTVEQRLALLEDQAVKMLAEIKAIRGQLKGAAAPDLKDIRIFRLKHVDSNQMARLLTELLNIRDNKTLRVVADAQTNSLLVAGKAEDQDIIQTILSRLDDEGADSVPKKEKK